jgi:hypothetical protein
MRVFERARAVERPRASRAIGRWPRIVAIAAALLVAVWLPLGAAAQETDSAEKARTLGVNLAFPDSGLGEGEQLCVALFPGTSPDLTQPPLLSRCLDPGEEAVTFEGLRHGEYSVLLPGPGSELAAPRYQGQLVATSIPDDQRLESFGIDVNVGLAPEFAGTTGRVEVSVFGCPAGTNAGSDEDSWAAECQALAGGIPLTLSGTGSIEDAAFQAITGVSGNSSGRVEFTNLPAGAYELGGDLPENVTDAPALFIESSIDGSLGSPCVRRKPSPSTSTSCSTRTAPRPRKKSSASPTRRSPAASLQPRKPRRLRRTSSAVIALPGQAPQNAFNCASSE